MFSGSLGITRDSRYTTPAVISAPRMPRTRSAASSADTSRYTHTPSGMSAPPMLMRTNPRRISGISPPTNMAAINISAARSLRRILSSTRWPTPSSTSTAEAASKMEPIVIFSASAKNVCLYRVLHAANYTIIAHEPVTKGKTVRVPFYSPRFYVIIYINIRTAPPRAKGAIAHGSTALG